MFSISKKSTTAKIEVISSAWMLLIIAMLATTVTLYDGRNLNHDDGTSQITLIHSQPDRAKLR